MLKPVFIFIVLLSNLLSAGSVMQFTVDTDYMNHRARIYASGDIEQGTALMFVNFIKQHNIGNARVYFNSDGGSLTEGIVLGEIIREMGYSTSIGTHNDRMSGTCASACAYAFAGGVYRYIYYDRQRLGLHQFYMSDGATQGNISSTQKTTAKIVKHLSKMGIDENAFVMASSTHKDRMTWLSKAEALKLNFANNGKHDTTVEVKIIPNNINGPKMYLKIAQERAEGLGKLLFYCENDIMNVRGMVLTTEESALRHSQSSKRHYFGLNDGEFLVQEGEGGITAKNRSLIVYRQLSQFDINRILNSNVMNIWTEDGGDFRWGIEIDIYPVKEKLSNFLKSCNKPKVDLDTTLSYF